jgi:phospholipase/carboxylesterase
VVLLHGRGTDENDLLSLAPSLPGDALVVAPRAPFDAAPWGYGPGYAWYRFLGGTEPEPESFARSQRALEGFLDGIDTLLPVPRGQLLLGGFSQGGTMALGFALTHAGRADGIINLSGFLPDHPTVRATADTVAGARFFWGHGTVDPNIPIAAAEAGWTTLRAAGAELVAKSYRMGHTISPQELADVSAWIEAGRRPG